MSHAIRTVLWFNGRSREAAEFYCSLIPDSRIEGLFASDKGGPDGTMQFQVVDLVLNGMPYQLLDAGPMFPLSECVSIMLVLPTQAQADRLWEALVEGGGSHGPCGWLKDRFGLSWQVVPDGVMQLTMNPDPAISARAMAAMMAMSRLDLAAIRSAAAAA